MLGSADTSISRIGAPDQATEGLGDPPTRHSIVIALRSKAGAPGLVQNVRPRPGNAIENQQAQGPAGNVDAIAHCIGSEETGVFFGPEDIHQRADLAIYVLGI